MDLVSSLFQVCCKSFYNGLKAMVLHDGEELISVKITDGSNSILLATCVDADELKNCGRFARGVIAMKLHDGDKVTAISKTSK